MSWTPPGTLREGSTSEDLGADLRDSAEMLCKHLHFLVTRVSKNLCKISGLITQLYLASLLLPQNSLSLEGCRWDTRPRGSGEHRLTGFSLTLPSSGVWESSLVQEVKERACSPHCFPKIVCLCHLIPFLLSRLLLSSPPLYSCSEAL